MDEAAGVMTDMFLATREACAKAFKSWFPNADANFLEQLLLQEEKIDLVVTHVSLDVIGPSFIVLDKRNTELL